MFEQYRDPRTRDLSENIYRGTCTVEIDVENMLVRRSYVHDGVTKWGTKHGFDDNTLRLIYENERNVLLRLHDMKYEHAPELIELDDSTRTVTQRFYGYSTVAVFTRMLYESKKVEVENPLDVFEHLRRDVVELYRYNRSFGLYKLNCHPVNLIYSGNRLINFDYKWATVGGAKSKPSKEFGFLNRFFANGVRGMLRNNNLTDLQDCDYGTMEHYMIEAHWKNYDASLVEELRALI